MHDFKVVSPDEARQLFRRQPLRTAPRRFPYWFVATVVIIMTAALVLLMPPTKSGATIGGYQLLAVVTGSMSPAVNTGDLVAVRPVDPAAIHVGDIITYRDHQSPALLITHRVIAITPGEVGPVYTTKGDANPVPDSLPVAASQVVGRVEQRIPYGGHVVTLLRTPIGVLSLIIVPGMYVLLNSRRLFETTIEESETA